MPRIITIIKRVTEAVAGATNFLARPRAASRIISILVAKMNVVAASVIDAARAILMTRSRSATNMVQITFDLVHENPVTGASQDAGGNWTNIANFNGTDDGAYAALDGATLAVLGTLRGNHDAQPNRPAALVISKVELLMFYRTVAFGVLSTWTMGYRVGNLGVARDFYTESTVNQDFRRVGDGGPGPEVRDITAALMANEGLTWANVAAMQHYFIGIIGANSPAVHLTVDAAKIRVTAREVLAL